MNRYKMYVVLLTLFLTSLFMDLSFTGGKERGGGVKLPPPLVKNQTRKCFDSEILHIKWNMQFPKKYFENN